MHPRCDASVVRALAGVPMHSDKQERRYIVLVMACSWWSLAVGSRIRRQGSDFIVDATVKEFDTERCRDHDLLDDPLGDKIRETIRPKHYHGIIVSADGQHTTREAITQDHYRSAVRLR